MSAVTDARDLVVAWACEWYDDLDPTQPVAPELAGLLSAVARYKRAVRDEATALDLSWVDEMAAQYGDHGSDAA